MTRFLLVFSLMPVTAFAQSTATPGNSTVGATTNYSITFTTALLDNTPNNGTITLTFPSGFTLSNPMIASSSNIDGGFSLGIPSGQSVTFTRDGTGTPLAGSTSYTIIVGTVQNPTSPGSAFTVSISTSGGTIETTSPFSIVVGSITRVRIETASGGSGSEVGNINTNTDNDSQQFFAVGYDQFDNFVSDVSVNWSVSGGIGSVGPGSGTSTTLTLNQTGSGNVFADDGSGHSDATGLITVSAGALNNIKVVEGSSGDGPEFTTRTVTTDQTLTVHAAGYDADDNYRSDEPVTWSVTNGIGIVSPGSGTNTTFNATTVTTGRIRATHASVPADETGDITVNIGALNYVRVNTGAGGNTSEVTTNTLTTGQTFTVHASGYDADNNYRGDVSVTWSVTGGIGNLSSGSGVSTTLTATTPGSGVIQATHATANGDATDTITVSAGAIASIVIRTEPNNGGIPVGAVSMTADESRTFYAASYDGQNNFLGDVSVSWSAASGNLAPPISGNSSSFTFNPTTAPTSGVIRATHSASGQNDVTGTISVSTGAISSIRINTGASGNSSAVTTTSLDADGSLTVHASEYDADGNYRGDISVDWSVTGGIGSLSLSSGISTTLNANKIGDGVIIADDGSGHSDATGLITVTAGALANIKIVEGASGDGPEFTTRTINTDQSLTVHAAGYDNDNNYIADQSVSWGVTNGIGTLSTGSGSSTTLNATTPTTGRIQATHAVGTDETGDITVTVGSLSFVRVNNGASGNTSEVATQTMTTGETFVVHASGYDADGNYRTDESVTWSVTGGIGNLSASNGTSTTLTATTPGQGVIHADHPTANDDDTGTITVQAGNIASITIRTEPNNGGSPVGAVTMTADETRTFFAASYDDQGVYLGDVSVNWSAASGNLAPPINATGSSFMFSPTTAPASGVIRATHSGSGETDDTGTISVSVGVLKSVKVYNGASGNTSEVGATPLTTGQQLTVHAAGFDGDGNYTGDESVNWSVTGGIGNLSTSSGISTTLTATTPGSGVIQADHATASDGFSGTITVSAGSIASIVIRNAANNGGSPVGAVTMTADETRTFFAASYDDQGVYLGDVSVNWSAASGSLAPAITGSGVSYQFSPTTAPASGIIRATHNASGETDDTGTITVAVGALKAVRVYSGANGNTSEVGDQTLSTGQQLVVHAAGFDTDGNYRNDESVTWSVTGGIGNLNAGPSISSTFIATTPGSGVIRADHPTVEDGFSGTIDVIFGSIDSVVVRDAPNNGGNAVGNRTLTADDSLKVYAAGYAQGNYVADVTVTWRSTGTLAPAINGTGSSFTFKPTTAPANGKIIADHPSAKDDSTGTITVNPGAPVGTLVLTPNPGSLPADGSSTSQVTSTTILDADGNPVGAGKYFNVTLSDDNLGSVPDANPGIGGTQVVTNASSILNFTFTAGTTGGTVNIFLNSIGGNANGNTQIAIGSMSILSIGNAPDFVSLGQTVTNVQMTVQNLSASQITNLQASLNFNGSGSGYTVQRTDGFTSIPGSGQRTLSFNVSVGQNATLGAVIVDGEVNGQIGGTPVTAVGAQTTHTWTLQRAAQLSAQTVASPEDTVVQGQQYTVTVTLSNPTQAGGAAAVIDDIDLKFFENGTIDRSGFFTQTPSGSNPTSIPAGAQRNFDFTVGVGASAPTGDFEIDAIATGHDANSAALIIQDTNGANTRLEWFVKSSPNFQILSLTPQPAGPFTAGSTTPWKVRMEVRNNGSDPIDLDSTVAKTYIQFFKGITNLTPEYTIVQPSQLVNSGGNRLNSGVTDFLEFNITRTGTTSGTITIRGRVEGIDQGTGNPIFDDTSDGGSNEVIISSQSASVFITQTIPATSTHNVSPEGVGIVDTSQAFQITVNVKNDLTLTVANVDVQLTTNGASSISLGTNSISNIPAGGTQSVTFDVTASSSASAGETFTAQITAAKFQSGADAPRGTPLDATAIFRIQDPANLQVQFTDIDPFQTAGDTFQVEATVFNSGEGEVGTGQLRLTFPATYTLTAISGNTFIKNFTVGQPVIWELKAPDTDTGVDTFIVDMTQIPTAKNTNTFAAVEAASDSQVVQTLAIGLVIQEFKIVRPNGATDDTLSTGQRFEVKVRISKSDNIDEVRFDLTPPLDYSRVGGANLSGTLTAQDTVLWVLDASGTAHSNPRTFQVRMRGFDQGIVRADTTASFNVVAVRGAQLVFDQPPENDHRRVAIGQQFQLRALVTNSGQAGVVGPAELTLDLGSTGITSSDTLVRSFVPGVSVIWNLTAPLATVPEQNISVTITKTPEDENSNESPDIVGNTTKKNIFIEVVEGGIITLDSLFVSQPLGAVDGVLSTSQQFTIEAKVSWNKAVERIAEISLPTGYDADPRTPRIQDLTSGAGEQFISWIINAPVNATPLQSITVNARAKDENSGQEIQTIPNSLSFTVVERSRLSLSAFISAPPPATDGGVTVGQVFTVTADLEKTGQARATGFDSLEIELPLAGGYSLSEPAKKAVAPGAQVNWQVKAPDQPHAGILNILVEVVQRGTEDENTNQFPPLTPDPPQVMIPVQTEAIALKTTMLTDKKPTTLPRGSTNVPIFGLQFANDSDAEIVVDNINLSVQDRGGTAIAPNSVFSRVAVVDYDNPTTVLTQLTPPGNNPVGLNLGSALSVLAGQSEAIEFRVDVLAQTEATNFELVIESPQDDITARVVASDTLVQISDANGQPLTSAISPGALVLIDANLEASFYNFPNPFGGAPDEQATSFNYNLSQDSDGTIKIYTLLGELVKTFTFNATNPAGLAGNHDGSVLPTILWDGTNDKGQKVLNGVYVAILTTSYGTAMTKIAVAK